MSVAAVVRITCRMLLMAACHQSCGSCSDHSGRGVDNRSGEVKLFTIAPSPPIKSRLTPGVENSIPSSVFVNGEKLTDAAGCLSSMIESLRLELKHRSA